jgi:hypothetical protein
MLAAIVISVSEEIMSSVDGSTADIFLSSKGGYFLPVTRFAK